MLSILVRISVLASLVAGAGYAFAVSAGAPYGRTGAFAVGGKAAEATCNACHGGAGNPPNSGGGYIRILDVPTNYVPGQTYPITVELAHPRSPLPPDSLNWGFQLQAVQKTNGNSVGTWQFGTNAAPDTFKIVQSGGTTNPLRHRRYVDQTRNNTAPWRGSLRRGELGPVRWTVNWQAPPADSGLVYFFAAGNATNGSFQPDVGDFIYTTAESTLSGSVDVPGVPEPFVYVNGLDAPYPNPMSICTAIDFTLARGGLVDVGIFDLQGRRVRTLLHEYRPVGLHSVDWNGRGDGGAFVRNGVYFIRLTVPGEKRPLVQKVTMSR